MASAALSRAFRRSDMASAALSRAFRRSDMASAASRQEAIKGHSRRFSVFNEFSEGEANNNADLQKSVKNLNEKIGIVKEDLRVRPHRITEKLHGKAEDVSTEAETIFKKVSENVWLSAATGQIILLLCLGIAKDELSSDESRKKSVLSEKWEAFKKKLNKELAVDVHKIQEDSTTSPASSSWRSDEEVRQLHDEWMAKYNRSYSSPSEKESRFKIFKEELYYIDMHNAAADRGEHTYWCGLNDFSDQTDEEFRARCFGYGFSPSKE